MREPAAGSRIVSLEALRSALPQVSGPSETLRPTPGAEGPLAGAMRPKALANPQETQRAKLFAENPPAFLRGASPDLSHRHPGEKRAVVAGFGGGRMTSDAGALLRGARDRAIGLVERFAVCFTEDRTAELISTRSGRWSDSAC